MIRIDFADKVIVVCGAGNGGIGAAVSHALSECGATVVAVDRTQQQADEIAAELRERWGAMVLPLGIDLMDRAAGATLIPRVTEHFARIDGLVNVVGGSRREYWRPLERYPDDIYAEVMSLNIDATFRACRDTARFMQERGTRGAIVNFASVSGLAGAPYHSVYGAAKAGIMALTRSMAQEWWRYGIRTNAVAPGTVMTPSVIAKGGLRETDERYGRTQVEPEEIAGAVVFLLSDLAGAVNGQTLTVDAGVSTRHSLGTPERFEHLRYD